MRRVLLLSSLLLSCAPVAAATITVTRFDDHATWQTGCTPTDCTLRQAVLHAAGLPGEDTIQLSTGTYVLVEQVGDDRVTVRPLDDIIIQGNGPGRTAITSQGRGRLFGIYQTNLKLQGLTLRDAELPDGDVFGGGAVLVRGGHLALERAVLRGNRATYGGAVYLEDATMDMVASAMYGNTGRYGGAIHATHTDIRVSGRSELIANTADSGGAAAAGGSFVADDDTVIRLNQAVRGGAFTTTSPGLSVVGVATKSGSGLLAITENHAVDNGYGGWGGAIHAGSALTLQSVSLRDNVSDYAAGGVYSAQANLTIRDSEIAGNSAVVYGGGFSAFDGEVLIERVSIHGNSAGQRAGAARLSGGGSKATFRNVDVYGNQAPVAAAIDSYSPLRLSHATIWNNQSGSGGDAVHQGQHTATYSNSILLGRCDASSGAISALGKNFRSSEPTASCTGSTAFALSLSRGTFGGRFEVTGITSSFSWAVNAGTTYCEARDVRDAARDKRCDIGAFEFGSSP